MTALDEQIANRFNELRLSFSDMNRQMDSNPHFKRMIKRFFDGKAVMVWNSASNKMSFKKSKK